MLNDQQRNTPLAHPPQELYHTVPEVRMHTGRRLVEADELRVRTKCQSDRQQFLLATGKGAGRQIADMRERQPLKQRVDLLH